MRLPAGRRPHSRSMFNPLRSRLPFFSQKAAPKPRAAGASQMSTPITVIYLDPDETAASARAKVEVSGSASVELVAPFGARWLQNPVHLRALYLQLADMGVRASLRSRDGKVREIAKLVGFPAGREGTEDTVLLPPEVVRNAASYKAYQEARSQQLANVRAWQVAGATVMLCALALPLAAALVFLPSATVVLRPATQHIEETVEVRASTLAFGINTDSLTLPAFVLETELTATAPQRAALDASPPRTKSTGRVVFANTTENTVTIPAGTRVAIASGVAFLTLATLTLPDRRGATVDGLVEAAEGGSEGNVPVGAITRVLNPALAERMTVINLRAFEGGGALSPRLVTQEDYNQVRQIALERAQQEAVNQLRRLLPPHASFYNESIRLRIVSEELAPPLGAEMTELSLTLVAAARAVSFSGPEVNQLLTRHLQKRQVESFLLPGSLQVRPLGVVTTDNDSVTFHVKVAGQLRRHVDEDQVRTIITGKTVQEAETLLSQRFPLASPPQILVGPFWVSSMPSFPWRITVLQLPIA